MGIASGKKLIITVKNITINNSTVKNISVYTNLQIKEKMEEKPEESQRQQEALLGKSCEKFGYDGKEIKQASDSDDE
ncbi:MAG: hypothetical protein L6R37_005157 [Teloschistes peruensis]|nr:MAG: hypothetical protein L6R37_005157 [Teloschistes peruensis]